MTEKLFYLLIIPMLIPQVLPARTEPVAITEYEAEPGSVEAFAIDVFTLAHQERYGELEPFFSRTWNDWNSRRDPEDAWRTVRRASTLSEIHLLPAEQSEVHGDVHYVRYFVLTKDGKRRGAELLVMRDGDEYKLAVQANRSDVGNDYVKLGAPRRYVLEQLNSLGAEIETEGDKTVMANMPAGHRFRLEFSLTDSELERLELFKGDQVLDLYLAIFDLEGTPTIKLKP